MTLRSLGCASEVRHWAKPGDYFGNEEEEWIYGGSPSIWLVRWNRPNPYLIAEWASSALSRLKPFPLDSFPVRGNVADSVQNFARWASGAAGHGDGA